MSMFTLIMVKKPFKLLTDFYILELNQNRRGAAEKTIRFGVFIDSKKSSFKRIWRKRIVNRVLKRNKILKKKLRILILNGRFTN